jgi:hypothetical protein
MTHRRREFLSGLAAAAAIPALAPALQAAVEVIEQRGGQASPLEPDQDAYDFWNDFLSSKSTPAAKVPTGRTRGEGDREAFYFHNGKKGLQPAVDIPPADLIDDGDVNVSLNVAAFKPANEDRATFERLQSAQLRLDFVQDVKIVDLVDTMAWTAVAVLRPDKQKKLPPIQDLSFDPSTAWKKMQNIVLPRGQGRWAVNLYAQKGDSFLSQLLQVLNKEIGRFSPVFGLPAISTTALQSFNQFYGAFHSKPEYLFRSNPVPVFGTANAVKQGAASHGLPLRTGSYVLVPVAQASELTDERLNALELKQGYLVPKNTPSALVHDAAMNELPGVTYATLDVTVKAVQLPCAK